MDVGQSDFTDPPLSVKYVIGSRRARYQLLSKSRLMSAGPDTVLKPNGKSLKKKENESLPKYNFS